MQSADDEILDHLSNQSMLHMQQVVQLDCMLEWLFEDTDTLVDGTTKAQVDDMTNFQKIELIEQLWDHPKMLSHPMLGSVGLFVKEIKPYKNDFRTADDLERASQ